MYADPSVSDETDFLPFSFFSFFFSQFIFIANHLRAAKCSLTLMYYRSREAGLHLLPPKQCASIPFPLQALQQLLPDAITSLEQEQLGLVCGLDSLKRRVKKGINYLIVLWKKSQPRDGQYMAHCLIRRLVHSWNGILGQLSMAHIQDFWVSSKTDGSTYHPLCQTAGHFYSSGLWYKVHKEGQWDNEEREKDLVLRLCSVLIRGYFCC